MPYVSPWSCAQRVVVKGVGLCTAGAGPGPWWCALKASWELEEKLKFALCGLKHNESFHPFCAQHGHKWCLLVCCQKPNENCSMHLLCLLLCSWGTLSTWKDVAVLAGDAFRTTLHAGSAYHCTANSSRIFPLTNGEQGRNPGHHKWECLKETPGSTERKVIKVILMSASCCFCPSGEGMSLGLVIRPKCCQRHSRHLCYSLGPHQGSVHFVTALISEPVLSGESICGNDELTYTGTFSFKYTSSNSSLQWVIFSFSNVSILDPHVSLLLTSGWLNGKSWRCAKGKNLYPRTQKTAWSGLQFLVQWGRLSAQIQNLEQYCPVVWFLFWHGKCSKAQVFHGIFHFWFREFEKYLSWGWAWSYNLGISIPLNSRG